MWPLCRPTVSCEPEQQASDDKLPRDGERRNRERILILARRISVPRVFSPERGGSLRACMCVRAYVQLYECVSEWANEYTCEFVYTRMVSFVVVILFLCSKLCVCVRACVWLCVCVSVCVVAVESALALYPLSLLAYSRPFSVTVQCTMINNGQDGSEDVACSRCRLRWHRPAAQQALAVLRDRLDTHTHTYTYL